MGRMMLSADRLEVLLDQYGFSLLYANAKTKEISFVRSSEVEHLFEHLLILGQGKAGEAVYAETAVSIVRYFFAYKCVAVVDFDLAIALETDTERHWTLLDSTRAARNWEVRLAEIAGLFAAKTTEKHGAGLLARMQDALKARDRYIHGMGDLNKIFDREHAYHCENSTSIISEAERIAFGSSLQNWAYDDVNLASLILVKHGSEIEGRPDPWKDVKPRIDEDVLLPRIYLLSDYIHECRLAYNRTK